MSTRSTRPGRALTKDTVSQWNVESSEESRDIRFGNELEIAGQGLLMVQGIQLTSKQKRAGRLEAHCTFMNERNGQLFNEMSLMADHTC